MDRVVFPPPHITTRHDDDYYYYPEGGREIYIERERGSSFQLISKRRGALVFLRPC
jgi:hypothetical protein